MINYRSIYIDCFTILSAYHLFIYIGRKKNILNLIFSIYCILVINSIIASFTINQALNNPINNLYLMISILLNIGILHFFICKTLNIKKINDEFTKVLYEENDENEENNYNLNDIIIDNKINEKEINIINFIIEGFEYKKIAAMLNINLNTVKKSIQRIYKKLNVKNKIELINKIIYLPIPNK